MDNTIVRSNPLFCHILFNNNKVYRVYTNVSSAKQRQNEWHGLCIAQECRNNMFAAAIEVVATGGNCGQHKAVGGEKVVEAELWTVPLHL